ncbi:MAG: hypothetical protein COS85_03410 [Armatimonadetes bacterium CG07_land_8_20_14_0_80_59_28]|nr:MAG: hypothetical protein COS85_03410 [Armatimonadetes bacterium CG07_land_8_20_14_0_80_59_28]PIY49499.1 MAG: hypothetical protein COZ05_00210 [Armatimonadetes bacterium CG_4_10_14_3_um_filter_59_10]PJB69080.1 MAG: hypothetical protein CO095_10415 [Armatimonadetes bacterium CG_4_9_14_3_um_filter_58_7]
MSNIFDMQKVIDSKQDHRKRLAALPIAEKLRLLEQLRDRTLAIRASREKPRTIRSEGEDGEGMKEWEGMVR